jgi:hypothetical protein
MSGVSEPYEFPWSRGHSKLRALSQDENLGGLCKCESESLRVVILALSDVKEPNSIADLEPRVICGTPQRCHGTSGLNLNDPAAWTALTNYNSFAVNKDHGLKRSRRRRISLHVVPIGFTKMPDTTEATHRWHWESGGWASDEVALYVVDAGGDLLPEGDQLSSVRWFHCFIVTCV